MLELALPKGWDNKAIGNAEIQYVDGVRREFQHLNLQLKPDTGLDAKTVAEHALKLTTSEIVYGALEDLYVNDFQTARRRLDCPG